MRAAVFKRFSTGSEACSQFDMRKYHRVAQTSIRTSPRPDRAGTAWAAHSSRRLTLDVVLPGDGGVGGGG